MARHMVIIGNGVVGFSAARQLRREDPDATVSIFSDEPHPFYLRGRLKDYVAGSLGDYEMILESRNLYRRERLNLFLQSPVLGLDTVNREVLLGHGERVRYDRLLVATGSAPVPLEVPGADLAGVFSLRTLADAEAIRKWMSGRRQAVVIGESMVGLHLAEGLARLGAEVNCMLLGEHFWPDSLDPGASALVEELLAEMGVRFHKRVRVARILGEAGKVTGVELEGGYVVPCDMLGHGCGFRPATALLEGTPVACEGGVRVDEHLRTSVEGIYAAGDVLGADGPGELRRQWRSSFRLGETAALNMLGRPTPVTGPGSLRTEICGTSLAVIGRGQISEVEPGVTIEAVRRGRVYRRLVFRGDMLVGAILVGDTSHAEMIEEQIHKGALREELGRTLLPALLGDEPRLKEPLRTACPICTDAIRLPVGALVGRAFECTSCRARLRLTYVQGRLGVVPEE